VGLRGFDVCNLRGSGWSIGWLQVVLCGLLWWAPSREEARIIGGSQRAGVDWSWMLLA